MSSIFSLNPPGLYLVDKFVFQATSSFIWSIEY